MEPTMPPEHVGPMRRAFFPRMLVQSEGRFQERKKLTMVKAQTCLTAGKTATTAVLDDGCESPAPAGDIPPRWATSRRMGISIWMTRHSGFSCR
jgi:hypothetical protein